MCYNGEEPLGRVLMPSTHRPAHPGEMLMKDFLEPLGVTQAEAARRMRVPFQRLNTIVQRRRAVSVDTAFLLEALTGRDAEVWMTQQAKWDIWQARQVRKRKSQVKPLSTR